MHPSASLKNKAVSGVKRTSLSAVVVAAAQFLQLTVLAHLLSRSDFGLMALVSVVTGFAQAFIDMGISNAIIHRQDATREHLSSLYWLNIMAGFVVFALTLLAIPLVVRFYHEPRLNQLLFLSALCFLIVPLGQQFEVLLQKELEFGKLTKVEIVSAVVGTTVAIICAFLHFGVLSLVFGQIANAISDAIMLSAIGWRRWRPHLHFKKSDLKGYASFGFYQMGSRSINYLSSNVDYITVGKFLGPSALGMYSLAYQLVVVPLSKINPIVNRVAFPVFAKKQSDNSAICRGYLELTRLLSFIIMPLLAGLAATAPVLIPAAFGHKWIETPQLVQILAVLGLFKALGNPMGNVLLAKGRADIGFKWNMIVLVTNVIVFRLVVHNGVFALSFAYVGLSVLYSFVFQTLMRRTIGLRGIDYFKSLLRPLIFSLAMGAVIIGARILLRPVAISVAPMTAILSCIGAFVFLSLVMRFDRDYVTYVLALLTGRAKQEAA